MRNATQITENLKETEKIEKTSAAAGAIKPVSKMSKGEGLYNWIVYSGINYWVNLLSSVAISDYFVNLGGKKHLERAAGGLSKAAAAAKLLSPEKALHHSTTLLKTMSLLSGGWLLLVPMKWLEDRKRPVVHWLNDQLGVDQHAPDGHKETPDEIYIEKEQPHQGWGWVIGRRFLATACVAATGQVMNGLFRDHKNSATYTGKDDIYGGKAVAERFIVDKIVKKGASYIPGGSQFIEIPVAKRWIGLAALDSIFTKITALVMKATNGAKKERAPKEIGDDASPLAPEVLAVTPAAPRIAPRAPSYSQALIAEQAKPEAAPALAM